MSSEQTVETVEQAMLFEKVSDRKSKGQRLIHICCTKKDGYEITYAFDNAYNVENIRIQITEDTEIESVSPIYSYAFLYENEIKDLFGVKIKNITLDYNGGLYRTAVKTPFNV